MKTQMAESCRWVGGMVVVGYYRVMLGSMDDWLNDLWPQIHLELSFAAAQVQKSWKLFMKNAYILSI